MSVSSGVGLAHSAIIGMRLALLLHTLQPEYQQGCALTLSAGVCIETTNRGVHGNYQQGCALTLSTGVCIDTIGRGVH